MKKKEAAAEKNREKRELTRMRKEENRTRAVLKGMVYIYGVPLASSGWHPEHLGTLLANLDSGRAKAFAQPASVTLLCECVVQRSMAYANRVVLQPEHLPMIMRTCKKTQCCEFVCGVLLGENPPTILIAISPPLESEPWSYSSPVVNG